MKVPHLVAVVQLPLFIGGYSLFKSNATQAISQNDGQYGFSESSSRVDNPTDVSTSIDFKFNPDELLDSWSRKPAIFTKAMLELKRLEEEPTCHRVAVQLLMNNCKGLDNIGDEEFQSGNGHLQKHHVESFAASLAICDLERGRFVIPYACNLFTSDNLYRTARDGKGKLQVSLQQVGGCLEALGQDHSHWNTWLSYRDKAILFCRAARYDIEKGKLNHLSYYWTVY
jgi:hypothetical protein